MNSLKEIETRLTRAIGLNAASVGVASIRLTVETRMKARGIKEIAAYAALLAESEAELQRLIEAVVVPETWFFRDQQPFAALSDWVIKRWLPAHSQGVLRILSMPCSTGEEPYSIVMALLDSGVPSDRFAVEAVDISNPSLQRARHARYGRNAFRGRSTGFRARYFQETESGLWQLNDSVQRHVQFRRTNLLDPAFSSSTSSKDVIFCRNLLIYLDARGQRQVLETIESLLSPGGIVFAGHAEAYLYSRFGFQSSPYPMAFAFHRRSAEKKPPISLPAETVAVPPRRSRRIERLPEPVRPPSPPSVSALPLRHLAKPEPAGAPRLIPPEATTLEECQRLADSGRLEAAMEKTEAWLQMHGPSARAYYLLGLAKDAAGQMEEASAFYRKALYLEPDHSEALAHLALIARNTGDTKAARQLQERLRRLETRRMGGGVN